MPLLAEGLIHDWNYILGRLLLGSAETVGRLIFGAGALAVAALLLLTLEVLRCWNAPAADTGAC